jgi:protein involved in polysaccharide export with SLBB domain
MKMRTHVYRIILSVVCLLAPLAHAQEYHLGPDDALGISVYREDELNRNVRVSSDGYISFPLLGKVQVEGLTVPELEDRLTEGLKRYLKKPQVTVFIQEYSTITVTGQVNKPGSYPLRGKLTVIEAIGLAEGFTKIAARNDVRILRVESGGNEKTIKVKVADIGKKGDRSKDVPLQRGDVVFVPESFF